MPRTMLTLTALAVTSGALAATTVPGSSQQGILNDIDPKDRTTQAEPGDAGVREMFAAGRQTVSPGHPSDGIIQGMGLPVAEAGVIGPLPFDPAAPPPSPLFNSPWTNFEAPVYKGLALSADESTLYATHLRNNSVSVIDVSNTKITVTEEIWVGLDPVSIEFQPGTDLLWVCCYSSDSIVVIDTATSAIVDTFRVGDRPVNVVFNDAGTFAFVVCEGSPLVQDPDPSAPPSIVQEGALVAVETTNRQIVRSRWLDAHTPRAALYDSANDTVVLAALNSGNNTTVVGRTIQHNIDNVPPTNPTGFDFREFWPSLVIPFLMPSTQTAFSSPLLSPWPDETINQLQGAELVARIVSDAGHAPDPVDYPWQEIVDILSLPNGTPDPVAVAEYKAAYEALFSGTRTLLNADDILQDVINDAKDTVDHDLIIVDASNPANALNGLNIVEHVGDVGARLQSMAMNPADGSLLLTNLSPNNLIRLENQLRGNIVEHEVVRVDNYSLPGRVITPANLHAAVPNFDDVSAPNQAAQSNSLAEPRGIVFRDDGFRAYIAASGVGRVGVIDANGTVLGLRDTGGLHGHPVALAISSSDELYALDTNNMTVTRMDASNDTLAVTETVCLHTIEPEYMRRGRAAMNSTRFANNYAASCATCHPNGHLDHTAWDLGDGLATTMLDLPHTLVGGGELCDTDPNAFNHPVKGPMVTMSLRGTVFAHEPFHWRGDKETLHDFNSAFVGLLGAETQIPTGLMTDFERYIGNLHYQPTFYRSRGNAFRDPGAVIGRDLYIGSCQGCHELESDGAFEMLCSGSDPGDVALNFIGPSLFAQVQLITQMRGLNEKFISDKYTGFGMIHDGREERETHDHPMETFLEEFFGGLVPQADEMIAFMEAFQTNVMPAVGHQILWDTPADGPQLAGVTQLINQYSLSPSRCDVVVRDTTPGASPAGYYLIADDFTPLFQSDQDTIVTLNDLEQLVASGHPLVVSAVPPGSGLRMGIDWDLDCISNGSDPLPMMFDGDANLSREVDVNDISFVLFRLGTDPAKPWDGDVNNDEKVDVNDISKVLFNLGHTCDAD